MIEAPAIKGDRKRGPLAAADRLVHGFTRAKLAELFRIRGYKRIAEIGVADGRFALTLCQTIPDIEYIGIDPWLPYSGNRRGGPREQHERNYALAQERLKPFNATLIREKSVDGARLVPLGSLDAVYIDGNHAVEFVMMDLIKWDPRVRSGGIVSGHDYYHFTGAGVVEAVNAHTKANGITDWWICDEREPSFWWVKP